MVLEKTLESSLDCKEIKPVHPKWNQSWIFIGRTDAEAEAPKLWPPDMKNWLIEKDPDAGKDWRQAKGRAEDEMAGWHHWFDGHESEWTPGVGDGQGGLVCCDSWGRRESDTTERLNWTELKKRKSIPYSAFLKLPCSPLLWGWEPQVAQPFFFSNRFSDLPLPTTPCHPSLPQSPGKASQLISLQPHGNSITLHLRVLQGFPGVHHPVPASVGGWTSLSSLVLPLSLAP